MNMRFQKLIKILSQIIDQQEKNQYIFPQELILVLNIQQQLLALSYIYGASQFSSLTIFTAFARPQIYIPLSILGSCITFIIALIYILNFIPLLNLKYTGIIIQLLKCGLLNFFFEITSDQFQILPHILIILISLINSIILEGTLNIKIENFQKIQLSFYDAILVILNIFIMILFKYTYSQIAIDITAFCIIFFQILNLIIGQPSISIKNKAIFLIINLFSLYFGIIKSFGLNSNTQIEMIILPLIYRISLYGYEQLFRNYKFKNIQGLPTSISQIVFFIKNIDNYSQLQVQTPASIEHQIIFSTIKMAKNLNYLAYKDLVSQKLNNNILLNLKINPILQQCLRKISYDTQNQSKSANGITLISKELIENENQFFQTQVNIIELLHDKIECMRLLMEENYILQFDHLLKYIEKLIKVQKILVNQYETFPCERTQCALGFFYTELLNDYLAANQLFSVLAISDEKMKKITLNQDVFNSKMIYLITQFNEKMNIKCSSQDANSFLGISNESLTNQFIDDLIPPGIRENHDEMIIDFLKNGKSKYLRQLQVNFLFYKYQQYMIEIDFAIETNLIQELNFIVFIQPTMSQVLSIILDINFTIVCMSKAFIQELDLQDSIKSYLGMKISKIIPSFPNIILEKHFIENAEAHFENYDVKQSSSSRDHPYHTSYTIRTKKLDDRIAFYCVQFEYFKKNVVGQVSSCGDSVNTSHHLVLDYIFEDNINEICDEAPVEIPIEDEVKRENPQQIYAEGQYSEQSHMINEFKYEQTNIKSTFRCNQTLLEQKYSNVHKNPSKVLISQKNESDVEQIKVHQLDECQSSQISSLQGLRRSEFYKKYELYQKLRFQVGNSKYHKLFIMIFTLSLITQVIIQSIQISKLNINLQLLAADIDLLQVKNLVYQPFESFLLTRWTIFNYIQMQITGDITQQEFDYLVEFPRSNLNLGYDQLDKNLKQVLDRISVSGFFENQSLDIYVYVSTGEGELYNLTLRNSIQILLNYLYEIKKRYQIEGTIVSDSPYVYYSYKNYLTMKSEFSRLNQQILNSTITKSQQEQSQEKFIFIITVGIAFIQFCISFNYFIQIQRLINKFYGLIQNMDADYTYQEITRLKFISSRLNKSSNMLFRFQINIEQREKEFKHKSFVLNIKKKVLHMPYYWKQYFTYYLYFVFVLVLMFGNALLTFQESSEYLNKYPETASFFKAISDVGTDIPTMYTQRDILYNIGLIAPFLNDTEKARLLQEIKDSLNRTTTFITLDFNLDSLIISKEFKDYYNQIQKENLCNFLPNYISSKLSTLCPQNMDQNLERGLLGLLIYISNFINTDMAINQFTNKLQQSYLELEGAFLVSYIIKDINTSFHFDLQSQTQFYIEKISVQLLIDYQIRCIIQSFLYCYASWLCLHQQGSRINQFKNYIWLRDFHTWCLQKQLYQTIALKGIQDSLSKNEQQIFNLKNNNSRKLKILLKSTNILGYKFDILKNSIHSFSRSKEFSYYSTRFSQYVTLIANCKNSKQLINQSFFIIINTSYTYIYNKLDTSKFVKMKEVFQKLTNYLIRVYLKNEENQIVFPPYVILLFRVQQAFLSLSYIYGLSNNYYIYVISIYARPQQFIIDSEIPQYIILMLSAIYIFTLLTIIPYNNIIGIFGQLLRCSMLNFFFEISKGSISIITHTLLILISFSETLIISGTLNVQTKNFQHTRFTNLDLIVVILNYLLMILYSYGFPQQIIMILAIILNILRIINQLLFSSFKNLITKSILLTIKVMTFFFGQFWLQINLSAQILMIPLIYKMIDTYYQNQLRKIIYKNQKQIPCYIISLLAFLENVKEIQNLQVSKPKKPRDRIIYSSFLMYQNKNYQAFLELNSIEDDQLSLIESFKKKIILQKCIKNLQHTILGTNKIDNIAYTIKLLLNSEEQNYSIQNDIVEIVRNKIHCLELFTQNPSHSSYENYHDITKKIILFKEKLEKQYKEFPCEKTQGILGFYYGEIMNDYLQANQLFSLLAMQDEKIKKITQNQDIFSNKMIYLILRFDGKLIIKRPSNDAAQFLQLSNQQLKGLELLYLIPKGVSEIHDDLVLNFLRFGKSKYMRQLNQCLLYSNEMECMSSVELLFDINFVDELNFIAFLQPPANQTLNLILNEQHIIKCLSQQFIQDLGLEYQYKQYQGTHINKLIPNFPKYFYDKQQIENTEIFVEKIDEQSQTSSHPLVFITTFNVHLGIVNDITKYYIISFDFIKRSPFYLWQNNSMSVPFMSPLMKKQNHGSFAIINDESTIHIPYQEDEVMKNQYIFQLNQQDFNFLDNTPTVQCQKKQETKLLSTLEYTNIKTTSKQNELLLAEQRFFSKQKNKPSLSNGDQVVFIQEVQSSYVSNLQGVRNSKYFRQFELMAKIKDLNSFSKLHRTFLASIILCVVFQFIIQIIQIIELNLNLNELVSDIDILQIKNFVFQPLETFLLTRWTIFNYKLLNDAGEISNLEYQNLIQFPLSNLNLGYDSLDKNLKQVFNRPALQNFLEKTYIDIYEYVTTNQGEIYNLNLRNSISILKNFQYSFKMAYELDGGIVSDSPYVYFQYKNYLTIKQQFSELNSIVLDQTLKRSLQNQSKLSIITFICFGALIIQYGFAIFYFILLQKMVLKHYSLIQYIQIKYIDFEINYLKKLIEGVNQNQNLLFRYQFRLENKESLLDTSNLKIYQKKRVSKQPSILNCHDIYYYLFFIFILGLTAGNASLTYYEGWNYLEKYPETAKFYKEVSDVGTDVPTMFAQRDVLYSRKAIIPYFNQSEYDSLLEEIVQSLNRTKAFIQDDYNFDKYVVSDSFKEFFFQIQNDNLCDFIPDELKNKSNNICQIVLNQNMKRGLQALLIYIINHITTDMEINQFTSRSQASYLELEGAFLVSNIIKVVNDKFNIDLMEQTNHFMNLTNMHNIIMFINLFFLGILILTRMKNKLIEKLRIAQRLTYIMPSKSIILDSNFERALRSLLKEQ